MSPNCTYADFAMYAGQIQGETGVFIEAYLVEGEVETKIFEMDTTGDPLEGTIGYGFAMQKFAADFLTDPLNILYDAGNAELDALIESITTFNGTFKFVFINADDNTNTSTTYTVGTCSIDCCLANLIQANLDCTCTDGDCCEDIKKAEKILILSRAATLDAANGDIVGATEKYNKAVELCGSTPCDCNC